MVQVAQDLIWVWAENGPDASLESSLKCPALIPELDDVEGMKDGRVTVQNIAHRDVMYGWETLMENVLVGVVAGINTNASSQQCFDTLALTQSQYGGYVTWA